MNFGQALEALKQGKLVRRAGWNGKGMYIYLAKTLPYPLPFFVLHNAQGEAQAGWNASTPDLLAEDWEVVP